MTEAQPDLLGPAPKKAPAPRKPPPKKAAAKPAPAKAAPAVKAKPEPKKKPGTAVAVDDPAKRQQVAQQQAPQPSNFLAIIMQAATNPACDVGKMQALLDMQRQIEERDAKKAFTAAFVALQDELPIINRDGKIEVRKKDSSGERTGALQQSTPYATYPAIMKVVKPILKAHRFTFSTTIEPAADGRIIVVSYLDHAEGHQRVSRFPLPAETSGSKNNVQGWGSSQQYGMRYNAIALLNIVSMAVDGADTDGHPGKFVKARDGGLAESTEVETLTDEQEAELNRKMVACRVPLEKVLSLYKIEKLDQLPRRLLSTVMKQCDDYAENQKRVAADRDHGGFPGDRVAPRGR